MAERRKIFRIEEMAAPRQQAQGEDAQTPRYSEIMHELGALRTMLAAMSPQRTAAADAAQQDEILRLTTELRSVQFALGAPPQDHAGRGGAPAARIANELDAVMICSEQATQKIIAAAEDIDQAANNLSASLKDDIEQGLAQDIRDRVIQIFEACNFQDLTSQRVAKVMAGLARIERQINRALDAAPPTHGPRLPSDRGHVSQNDIDSVFTDDVRSA